MKGDRVEALVDTGAGVQTFEIVATKAGRRIEVNSARGVVEVTEVTRSGKTVRTGRFMAAQALVGSKVRVTRDLAVPLESRLAPVVMAPIHPSAVLRAQGGPAREEAYAGLVADLRAVSRRLAAA